MGPRVIGDLAQMVERSLSMREALGSMPRFSNSFFVATNVGRGKTTATGFEPARAEPIGFQVQLLNLSDTLSVEPTRMRCRGVSPCKSDFSDACGLRATYTSLAVKRGYGATVARLTPDQTVGRSNRSGLILVFKPLFAAKWGSVASFQRSCKSFH